MNKQLQLVESCQQVQQIISQVPAAQGRIGLVPTMGALHEGHLSLVRASCEQCDYTVVTIFVNPTQFAPAEDLAEYPRTLKQDLAHLQALGVDLVFAPCEDEIYPAGFSTSVVPPAVAQPWEGTHRPSHFAGVATVICKLFNTIPADVAFFGEKDYQQAMVIQQLVRDLNFSIELQFCPIVRDTDGLALSSRNQYLDHQQRGQATILSTCLQQAQQWVKQGERATRTLTDRIKDQLREAGIEKIDYVVIVHPATLVEVEQVTEPARLLLAVQFGDIRLIDNCCLIP